MNKIVLERTEGRFGFEATDEKGHVVLTDSSLENGGNDSGIRPMQLMLVALGSCSGIDLVTILLKQRQQIDGLKIEVEGEREKDVIPSLWKNVHISYFLTGPVDPEKLEKAASLSMEKYCSVAETMRRAGTVITWETAVLTPVN